MWLLEVSEYLFYNNLYPSIEHCHCHAIVKAVTFEIGHAARKKLIWIVQMYYWLPLKEEICFVIC
jgi:hypothetical protein